MTAYRQISEVPLFRYGFVMADPAWHHEAWSEKGQERAPSAHYRTTPLDEVLALPVGDLCGADAVIWLWIPGCFIDQAPKVLDAWGVRFVTMGFWVKTQVHAPTKPKMGTGHVLRECGEPFVIGKIGAPQFPDKGVPSVIMEPRREHSRKPEAGYALAERLAPKGYPKLDMFSRQARPGWDRMGDEHDKFKDTNGRCGQADWKERAAAKGTGGARGIIGPQNTSGISQVQQGRACEGQSTFGF